ncbi:hypothetical protein H5410_035877 [Solanum commersonii]|uniref:Uncharacterized protein n=1 Tax=Solanum commersonii TaxID=4109 RepID=A0A9J5Y351_SOLCO|nr:hypothetical protein H5410_035877 [Solanum commersonii]
MEGREASKSGATIDNVDDNPGIGVSSISKHVHESTSEPTKEDVRTSLQQNDIVPSPSQAKRQKGCKTITNTIKARTIKTKNKCINRKPHKAKTIGSIDPFSRVYTPPLAQTEKTNKRNISKKRYTRNTWHGKAREEWMRKEMSESKQDTMNRTSDRGRRAKCIDIKYPSEEPGSFTCSCSFSAYNLNGSS